MRCMKHYTYTNFHLRCPITTLTTYGITVTRYGSDRMLFVFRPFTWSTIDERSQTNEHQKICDRLQYLSDILESICCSICKRKCSKKIITTFSIKVYDYHIYGIYSVSIGRIGNLTLAFVANRSPMIRHRGRLTLPSERTCISYRKYST